MTAEEQLASSDGEEPENDHRSVTPSPAPTPGRTRLPSNRLTPGLNLRTPGGIPRTPGHLLRTPGVLLRTPGSMIQSGVLASRSFRTPQRVNTVIGRSGGPPGIKTLGGQAVAEKQQQSASKKVRSHICILAILY